MGLFNGGIMELMLGKPGPEHNVYMNDAEGNQQHWRYQGDRTGPLSIVRKKVSDGAWVFQDNKASLPPEAGAAIDKIFPEQTGRHFSRVGGTEGQNGFNVSDENFKNMGQPGFMQQAIANNPNWQFGQQWNRPQTQGINSLPQGFQFQTPFQNTKMIEGKPHRWDGAKWIPTEGY